MSSRYAIAPGFKRKRKIGERGAMNRRVLHESENESYERYYHATKGWRTRAKGNHAVTLPMVMINA